MQQETLVNATSKLKKPCCKNRLKKEPWTAGALLTEYQKEYLEKRAPQERVRAVTRNGTIAGAAPFDGTTSYNLSYKAPEVSGRQQPFLPQRAEKDDMPFDPWTTYKADYPAKEVPYSRVRPMHQMEPAAGPFDDATTHKLSYPGWIGKPRTPAQGRSVSVPRGSGPFEGLSAYKDDYRKWPTRAVAPAAPLLGQRAALPGGAFNDATTHRTVYTAKGGLPAAICRPDDGALKPEGWYNGAPSTEYRQHYQEKPGGPPQRVGATIGASGAVVPKGPFAGSTTYGLEFRPRTAPDYVRAARPADEPQAAGPFLGSTTYGDSFIKKDVPYIRVRPAAVHQPNDARFEDATENKTQFQNWGPRPATRASPAKQGIVQAGPFDGDTTYKMDYVKQHAPLATQAIRPASGTRKLRQPGPFDGTTTYTVDYPPKYAEPMRSYRPGTCSSCDPASDCEDI